MRKDNAATCACAVPPQGKNASPIETFTSVRAGCPALHRVFLPDSIWPKFQDWCKHPDDVACHQSVLLLAYQRRCLRRITSPIHRYLLASGAIRAGVRKQYVEDLQEKWMGREGHLERHRKWRAFRGRLAELQLAAWLEDHSYRIDELEALREGPDIEAVSPDGFSSAFELKFVGSEDADFEMRVKSIAGQECSYWVSPYAALNYLTFRVYEAAKQLQKSQTNGTAVVIIDEVGWWRFQRQLGSGWVNWKRPQFVGIADDPKWNAFIREQEKNYPALAKDLAETICSINSIWIFVQSSDLALCHKYDSGRRSIE